RIIDGTPDAIEAQAAEQPPAKNKPAGGALRLQSFEQARGQKDEDQPAPRRDALKPAPPLFNAINRPFPDAPPEPKVIQWTQKKKQNLAHFSRARKGERDAARPSPDKPQPTAPERLAYIPGAAGALDEAKLVKKEVLAKVNPELASVFQVKFIRLLELISRGINQPGSAIDPDAWRLFDELTKWWSANGKDLHFPDAVPVQREDSLD